MGKTAISVLGTGPRRDLEEAGGEMSPRGCGDLEGGDRSYYSPAIGKESEVSPLGLEAEVNLELDA